MENFQLPLPFQDFQAQRVPEYTCDYCGKPFRVSSTEDKLEIILFGATCPQYKERILNKEMRHRLELKEE